MDNTVKCQLEIINLKDTLNTELQFYIIFPVLSHRKFTDTYHIISVIFQNTTIKIV